ncbi:hypothetical protein LSCM1_05211 [Leishmania martiniquensis]|uniref:Uncharacterized protein n=1 Tax=Leishmania martiniquensis TaxID=1580590 RepID=A0A836GN49_9TRYP|nr:hypothetical protein LSCM1_05211 [Leishmania martiniquensis]
MSAAADALLLSLEVEAAAARNAELSRTIDLLQDEVRRLRDANASPFPFDIQQSSRVSPRRVEELSARPGPHRDDTSAAADAKEAFLILDDLLFELADIRSRVTPDEPAELARGAFGVGSTVRAHATRCLEEARRLKEVLIVKQHSTELQVSELRRALGEQVEANEKRSAAGAAQSTMLERQCAARQRDHEEKAARDGRVALDRVIQPPVQPSPHS